LKLARLTKEAVAICEADLSEIKLALLIYINKTNLENVESRSFGD
jgi:hypothetical protein